jgi:CspA family cold shock protein
MKTGKVKWFNNAKGYGFILADDSNEDLFAHYSTIQMDGYRTLKAGQAVQFDTKPSDKGTHAINIRALDSDSLATADNEASDERTLSAEGA